MDQGMHRQQDALQKQSLAPEARNYRRVEMELPGRFMRADRSEHSCTLKVISVGGASLATKATVDVGERVIVYLDHLGGIEGVAMRLTPEGFAFQFKVSEHKREKLAAQIMWLMNRDAFPEDLGRKHDRVRSGGRHAMLSVEDDVVIDVELLDLSASGASCSTPARPAIGSFVTLNKTRAIVRRHHEQGIGLQFLTTLSPETLKQSFP